MTLKGGIPAGGIPIGLCLTVVVTIDFVFENLFQILYNKNYFFVMLFTLAGLPKSNAQEDLGKILYHCMFLYCQ